MFMFMFMFMFLAIPDNSKGLERLSCIITICTTKNL